MGMQINIKDSSTVTLDELIKQLPNSKAAQEVKELRGIEEPLVYDENDPKFRHIFLKKTIYDHLIFIERQTGRGIATRDNYKFICRCLKEIKKKAKKIMKKNRDNK